jgi:hypothetical protein
MLKAFWANSAFYFFILIQVLMNMKTTLAFNHIKDYNSHIAKETNGFFSNMMSGTGFKDNIDKVSQSFQAWTDLLSDQRWSNRKECGKKKSKNLIVEELPAENKVISDQNFNMRRAINRQLESLDKFEMDIKNSSFPQSIIDDNIENASKYRKILKESLEYHSDKRRLQSTGYVSENYRYD